MMRTTVLLHGAGAESYSVVRDRRSAQIRKRCGSNAKMIVPALPNPESPSYEAWSRHIARTLADSGPVAVLVAHSVAGSIVLKLLAETAIAEWPQEIHVLAAPFWCGLDHDWQVDEFRLPTPVPEPLRRFRRLYFYHGNADGVVPISHLDEYAAVFPEARVRRLPDQGHMFENGAFEWLEVSELGWHV